MKPAFVTDVGNSRLKWGRCLDGRVVDSASLPLDDPTTWENQWATWTVPEGSAWAVGGVQPARRDSFVHWLRQRGQRVEVLESHRQLPLHVLVENPEKVGIDRLLDAVAVNMRRPPAVPAVIVDAGSAVTVDLVDGAGRFRGGAIFPGLSLMARALHEHTALLPLVEIPQAAPSLPGASTRAAIRAGIFWATAGAIDKLVRQIEILADASPQVFLAGGDGPLLEKALSRPVTAWPLITLEGLRLAAESLP